jgi:hypothetical protein
MKFSSRTANLGLLACAAAASCNSSAAAENDFEKSEYIGWYGRVGAFARFNPKASITGARPILPNGIYDNGFVLPDTAGPGSAKTWNWGYNSASQISGDTLTLTRFDNVPSFGRQDVSGVSPLFGGEVVAGYNFTEFEIGKKIARVGFEIGYGYSTFSSGLDFSSSGIASLTTGTYGGLSAIIPPTPPYAGTAKGPGPLINLPPNSVDTATSLATTVFNGNLKTEFHELRLGPNLEVDLTPRLMAAVGVGYSTVYVSSRLRYNETTTFAVFPTANSATELTRGQWCPGVYAEARMNYQFTKHLGVFLGADVRYNTSLNFGDSSHQVRIELGATFAAKAGVNFRF